MNNKDELDDLKYVKILLAKMIQLDPCKRISPKAALNHVRYYTILYIVY